jgi:hypothetical protein
MCHSTLTPPTPEPGPNEAAALKSKPIQSGNSPRQFDMPVPDVVIETVVGQVHGTHLSAIAKRDAPLRAISSAYQQRILRSY